jgi:putative acetyltransferase
MMEVEIREERETDFAAIGEVNGRAFGQELEGKLVDALRGNGAGLLSLVAVMEEQVVGHIFFSPVTIGGDCVVAGLGPMAVLPEFQRQGIGSRLIQAAIEGLEAQGLAAVIVLGHHEYYPRFGFVRASSVGISCEWEVPDEAFMVRVLDAEKMRGVGGTAKYREEFSSVV